MRRSLLAHPLPRRTQPPPPPPNPPGTTSTSASPATTSAPQITAQNMPLSTSQDGALQANTDYELALPGLRHTVPMIVSFHFDDEASLTDVSCLSSRPHRHATLLVRHQAPTTPSSTSPPSTSPRPQPASTAPRSTAPPPATPTPNNPPPSAS